MAGIQKWALVAYLVLCVYFISRPSPDKITKRAEALDAKLAATDKELLAPALASALQMPPDSLSAFLHDSDSKPSTLIFQKLLQNCGSENCEESPAQSLLKAGMPVDDALSFFDKIEEKVIIKVNREKAIDANNHKPMVANGPSREVRGSVRSTPN